MSDLSYLSICIAGSSRTSGGRPKLSRFCTVCQPESGARPRRDSTACQALRQASYPASHQRRASAEAAPHAGHPPRTGWCILPVPGQSPGLVALAEYTESAAHGGPFGKPPFGFFASRTHVESKTGFTDRLCGLPGPTPALAEPEFPIRVSSRRATLAAPNFPIIRAARR